MKKRILRMLMDYCSKRAFKYHQRVEFLNNMEGIDYIYAAGSLITKRNKWLKRTKNLQLIKI